MSNPTAQTSITMTAVSGSASSSESGPSPGGYGSVGVSVVPSVITVSLSGTTLDASGNDNILVGQGCKSQLDGIPTNLLGSTTYYWTVTGTTFQSWTVSADSTRATLVGDYYVGRPYDPTEHWYWNDPQTKTETVTCKATITPPAGQGATFSVTAAKAVIVQVPAWKATATGGYMQVNVNAPGLGGAVALYAGPGNANQLGGINFTASSTTPIMPAFGFGTVALAQLATPNLSYVTSAKPPVTHNDPENGMKGLDHRFPYAGVSATEGGPTYVANDSPGIDLVYFKAGSALEKHQFIVSVNLFL